MQLLQTIPAGGGGATTFLGLTDTPAAYTGDALKSLRVNAGETAVEHYDIYAAAHSWAALQTFNAGVRLAASQQIQDSGGTGRVLLATSTPHTKLTGDVQITDYMGVDNTPQTTSVLTVGSGGSYNTTIGANVAIGGGPAIPATNQIVGVGGYAMSRDAAITDVYGLDFLAGMTNVDLATAYACRVALLVAGSGKTLTTGYNFYARGPLKVLAAITTHYGFYYQGSTVGTNRYGFYGEDISGGTLARLIQLGPATPYFMVKGSGEWSAADYETPMWIGADSPVTSQQVTLGAADSAGAGFRCLRVPNL